MRQANPFLVAVCCACTLATASAQTIRFIELDETLPWDSFSGVSANERGDVAFTTTTDFGLRSYIVRAGETARIIAPTGFMLGYARVMGIADDGHVMLVNTVEREKSSWRQLYRYYDNDHVVFAAEAPWSYWGNTATSSAGHAAFYSSPVDSQSHRLVLINPDNTVSMPSDPGGLPFVFDANRHGVFAGRAGLSAPPADDALIVDAAGQYQFLSDQGHIGGAAINDHGSSLGAHASDGVYPGRDAMFLWDTVSGDFESVAIAPDWARSVNPMAINNAQLIGGHFRIWDNETPEYAFLWSAETGYIDPHQFLSDELQGVRLTTISDITDSGLVVGTGRFADGTWGVFTLQIPAPGSSFALGGLALLGLRRRR